MSRRNLLLFLKCKFKKIKPQMFTGIIETLGRIKSIEKEQENVHFTITSNITSELKIDQSVAHNGVCLTVVAINNNDYTVTAIKETLLKTNLGTWNVGDAVNLERAMKLGDRLDGHIVQGHVDQIGKCIAVKEVNGSWYFTFTYDASLTNITIEKGSITINGVSLTVVNSKMNEFSVAIIPYTFEHTNFHSIKEGDVINLEFDVIGKYVSRLNELRKQE
jgi:riboflavin synthase